MELSALSLADLARFRAERPDTRLLDVRTPGEFEAEHIGGAYNGALDTLAEPGAEIRAGTNGPVVLVWQAPWWSGTSDRCCGARSRPRVTTAMRRVRS
jgi:rhodanese-related sulfurtransferase